jgi:cobalt/nickel transport system ATP-binding protein
MGSTSVDLDAVNVWRTGRAHDKTQVLHGVSVSIAPGECVALIGANGAGKSSLLFALVGALPSDGRIEIGGKPLNAGSLDDVRRQIGFVFEDPREQLFMPSVREEVAFGPRHRGLAGAELDACVDRALSSVNLSAQADARPNALSLGQQRRLAVATVLALDPALILLDEPTASLDPLARRAMIEVIGALGATRLWATHDLDAALDLNARVLVLSEGRLVADGPGATVLADERLLAAASLALPLGLGALRRG